MEYYSQHSFFICVICSDLKIVKFYPQENKKKKIL